jgi:hypothetical protein
VSAVVAALLALGGGVALAARAPAPPRCDPPAATSGVASCRVAVHGTPDLGRAAWRARFGGEVTLSERIFSVAANPGAGGARSWPLVDSLGQPMGRLESGGARALKLRDLAGAAYRVSSARVRGHGCAADPAQSRSFPLVQVIAPRAPAGGTQAFVDARALDPRSASGARALRAFRTQRGGGTGCGPTGPERGRRHALTDPAVGATAHARLSSGALNSVTEYDAKPAFGSVVYFMTNTTAVRVGGIARGMVRVGTPVATVDRFAGCDPGSDGTLTWRYLAIHTGRRERPRLFGWVPRRCAGS